MYCNYPGCTASLKVEFQDEDEDPVVVEVDRVHAVCGGGTHEPSPVARVVKTTVLSMIKKLSPVKKFT